MSPVVEITAGSPGLLRMIVVNTHRFKNRIEELPLDAHTAILARNQSGKTSLMKLLPFFWGSLMREIQPPAAEKKSFIEFYLPTDASYLACEYRNAKGEVRSVVVHTDPSKTNIQYRLVRGGLSSELFLVRNLDGSTGFVKNIDFESHAKKLGYDLNSRLITSTKDYRGVIQGRFPTGSTQDKQFFAGLIHEYGIGRRSAPLDNVDKLFLTMLDNNFSIADLLSIVTNKVVDFSTLKVSILGGANSPENIALTQDYRSYRKVMSHEQVLRDAEAADNRRETFEAELLTLTSKLVSAVVEAEKSIAESDALIADTNKALQVDTDRIDTAIREASEDLGRMAGDIASLKGTVDTIDTSEKRLLGASADKAQAALAARPDILAKLALVREKIGALSGNRAEIEARFSRIIDGVREAARNNESRIDNRLIAIPNEVAAIEQRLTSGALEFIDKIKEKHLQDLRTVEERIAVLQDNRDRILDQLADPKVDQSLLDGRDRQMKRRAEKESELSAIQSRADNSAKAAERCQEEFALAEKQATASRQKVETLQERLERIQSQREPEQGSLRQWLEKNRPEWRDTIGKVIDEALLNRTDMAPTDGEGEAFFGVAVNLASIMGGCPSLESLEREQADVFSALAIENAGMNEAKSRLDTAAASRQKAFRKRDQDAAQVVIAQSNHAAALAAEQEAIQAVTKARDIMRQEILSARASIDADIASARKELKDLHELQAAEIEGINVDRDGRIAAETSDIRAEGDRLHARKQQIAAERDAEILRIGNERDAAIQADGSDPERIKSLGDEEKELAEKAAGFEALEVLKARWDEFCSNDMPKRIEAREKIRLLELESAARERQLSGLRVKREETTVKARKTIDNLAASRNLVAGNKLMAETRLKAGGVSDDHEPHPDASDPKSIPDLIEEMDNRVREQKKAFSEVAKNVNTLRAVFTEVSGKIRDAYGSQSKSLLNAPSGPKWLPLSLNGMTQAMS